MKILITGASGFVGRHMVSFCLNAEHSVTAALRAPDRPQIAGADYQVVGEIDGDTDWSVALEGADAIIHTAARVHLAREDSDDPLHEYRRTNREGTFNLALQAAHAGVRRFLFISSIAAEAAEKEDEERTLTPYGLSKWEAEKGLRAIAESTRLAVTVLRPPMIYGPDAPGAFSRLARSLARGLPLPLAGIDNQRSALYVGNLADAALSCLSHPDAVGQTFAISDGAPVSTPALARAVAKAQGRRAILLPCPKSLLRRVGPMTGHEREIQSLLGSRVVDDRPLRETLGWSPPWTLDSALAKTFARIP